MIRVLFMQSQTFLGADTRMHMQLMNYLDRDRFEVHVACNPDRQAPGALGPYAAIQQIPGIKIRPTFFGPSLDGERPRLGPDLAWRALRLPPSLAALVGYIRSNQIDIIHGTEKPRDALYGVLLGKLTGAKSIVHLHVKWDSWLTPMARWALAHADAIIGVSSFVAQSAVRGGGYDPSRVYSLVNGIEPERWDFNIDGAAIRDEFGVPFDVPLLGVVSRLFYWKGHVELLRALALVKQEGQPFKLLVVGEDDPRSDPGRGLFSEELKGLTAKLGLRDDVMFTGFRSDIPRIMAALDVYTMPTFEEPCAVVFLEAMAMKKPIVALDSGGTPEEVLDGVTGYLTSPGDAQQLAQRILTLLRNVDLRQRMGERGRARVESELTARKMASRAEDIYKAVLGCAPAVRQGARLEYLLAGDHACPERHAASLGSATYPEATHQRAPK